jgi:MFS family permease
MTAAVDPFLIVYGFQELALQVQYLGLALVAYAAGQFLGYLIWPRWIARHSPRVPFQIATLLRLLLLSLVIALPALSTSDLYTDRLDDPTVAMRGFAIAFALLGIAGSVGNAANQRYLMDIAPRGATQGPILAANLVAAVCAFGPFGVAWLLQRYELERILWGATGIAILALLASGLLIESRVRVRTTAGSWRSRRQAPRAA